MRAAVLNAFGVPLAIKTMADPAPGAGEVVVDVAAAGIPNYTAGVLSGARNYLLDLPVVPGPGGIGRIRATGPDTTRFKRGDWVFCDSTVRSRDDAINPDLILQGWTYRTEAARPLHQHFHHGSFAEQMLVPAENVTPIGDINPVEAGLWSGLGRLLVPYGGLQAIRLRAGETLVVNGATGGFGGAAVAVALGMGAGKVVATGRNRQALDDLVRRHGSRVRPAPMTGVEADDRRLIMECADGPIDCVLDLLPREATALQVRAAVLTVRPGGRVVLMGGVGRAGGADLELPYSWLMRNETILCGKFMYPREAVAQMVRLVRAGLIDLAGLEVTEFALDEVNPAVAHAAAHAGPRQLTVLRPDRR